MDERQLIRLYEVLERERMALVDADFAALSVCAVEKERALQDLSPLQLSPIKLQNIADQIKRNQHLLGAAIKGIKAAGATVKSVKDIAAGSVVYGRNGEVSRMRTGRNELSQKL